MKEAAADARRSEQRIEAGRGGSDDPLRFFNLRAQYYHRIADLLEHNMLDGLRDEATIGQLAGIRYELDPSGRMKIEFKEARANAACAHPTAPTR